MISHPTKSHYDRSDPYYGSAPAPVFGSANSLAALGIVIVFFLMLVAYLSIRRLKRQYYEAERKEREEIVGKIKSPRAQRKADQLGVVAPAS